MAPRSELSILIVDDDPAIVRLLTAVLTADGFPAPTVVGSGGDALAASEGVDVVLLDHNLPDMQGTEVLEHLNRHAQPPSVVLITAHGDESVAATALRHGAEDYLVKDASLVKLVPQVIERVRRTRALRESLAAAEHNLMLMERRAALGEMSVTLRHEINNPLMSAMAEVELLLDDAGDAEQREALLNVQRSLGRIRDIVNRTRDLRTAETTEYLEGVRMVDLDAAPDTQPHLGPALVYVADESLCRVVSLLLDRSGYTITRCAAVDDLEKQARSLGIKLVVLSSGAPGADPFGGLEPKEQRDYTLVALVPDDGASAIASGADHVIHLPFDPATFEEEIAAVRRR